MDIKLDLPDYSPTPPLKHYSGELKFIAVGMDDYIYAAFYSSNSARTYMKKHLPYGRLIHAKSCKLIFRLKDGVEDAS